MKRLFSLITSVRFGIPSLTTSRWVLPAITVFALLGLAYAGLTAVSTLVSTDAPSGSLHEGIVGTPRLVNPILATSQADLDVARLVYSGLTRLDATGSITPDLAANWTVSEDQTTYTVTLRTDATFHDGVPVTATDVLYTIELLKDTNLPIPRALQAAWSGIAVEQIDEYEIAFTLPEPYGAFPHKLTLGILPAHLWRETTGSELLFNSHNLTPIGSGPYRVVTTSFTDEGTVSEYQLTTHHSGENTPAITDITLRFYADTIALNDAFTQNDITSSAQLTPSSVTALVRDDTFTHTDTPLTRTFGLFFNQNNNAALRDDAVREALDLITDRTAITESTLDDASIPSYTTVAYGADAVELSRTAADASDTPDDQLTTQDIATQVLLDADWTQTNNGLWSKSDTPLTLTIHTTDTLQPVATAIATQWQQFGIATTVATATDTTIVTEVLQDRSFAVLLFGFDPGLANDLYPFWHSSQQSDPGLNIAQYANLQVDAELTTLRESADTDERAVALQTIHDVIDSERPALFLFRPVVQYVTPQHITTVLPPALSQPTDRFTAIQDWRVASQSLWDIF